MLKDKVSSWSERMERRLARLKVYRVDKRKTMRYIKRKKESVGELFKLKLKL